MNLTLKTVFKRRSSPIWVKLTYTVKYNALVFEISPWTVTLLVLFKYFMMVEVRTPLKIDNTNRSFLNHESFHDDLIDRLTWQ